MSAKAVTEVLRVFLRTTIFVHGAKISYAFAEKLVNYGFVNKNYFTRAWRVVAVCAAVFVKYMPKHSVSFVIPCLNEEQTLPYVLRKINAVRENELKDRRTEIVVSDNGSADRSIEVAESFGARVIRCKERGYGAALQCGIYGAECEAVVFADADDTYDFLEAPKLVEKLDEGYDFVLGSRIRGTIHKGAMPFLHHRVGTPVLTVIINMLYARGDYRLSDCNSGFRCFRREAFASWNVKSPGMEFASEMLVKAMKSGAKIGETPVSLHPDKPGRQPHLRTWRDGMRHLLQIFLEAPGFFSAAGFTLWIASWAVLLASLLWGPINFSFVSLFGLHSMMFAMLGSFFGVTVWGIGLALAAKQPSLVRLYDKLIQLPEDKLFWYSLLLGGASLLFFAAIFINWSQRSFVALALEKETLALVSFASNGLLFVSNVILAHLVKRV